MEKRTQKRARRPAFAVVRCGQCAQPLDTALVYAAWGQGHVYEHECGRRLRGSGKAT